MPMGVGKYPDLHAAVDKLHPGEPCFLLRAQDLIAPGAVLAYAAELKDRRMYDAAEDVIAFATAMTQWQVANPGFTKLPD